MERSIFKMKKKVVIICIVVLVAIGITVAVINSNNSKNDTLIEEPNVNSDYDFQLYYENNGTVRLEMEKGEHKKGSWSCDPGDGSKYVDIECKNGSKDVFSINPKNVTGNTDLVFVLNDGEKDVYKIVFFYSAYNGGQSVSFKYATECADVSSFGSDKTVSVTCDTDNPSVLTLNIVSKDGSWSSDYDEKVVSLMYDYSDSEKVALKISAVSSDCDSDVTLTGGMYQIKMKVHIDEKMFVSLVSGEVVELTTDEK